MVIRTPHGRDDVRADVVVLSGVGDDGGEDGGWSDRGERAV